LPTEVLNTNATQDTLVAVLNSAVDDGLISSNPALRWGRVVRSEQTQVEEIELFTPEELTRLLEVIERDYHYAYPFILCLARTGLRLGEAMALQWADVDFAQRVLLVRRSVRRGVTAVPKNGKARRVDMSRQLSAVLRNWKTLRDAEAVVEGHRWPAPGCSRLWRATRALRTPSGGSGRASSIRPSSATGSHTSCGTHTPVC
jgi:integrase